LGEIEKRFESLESSVNYVEKSIDENLTPRLDFSEEDIVDLKTSTRMPSRPTEAQKRQMAFYSMAYPNNSVDLFFATPKDYKKFTLDNLSLYKKQLKSVAFSIQKFLSISNDKHELASLVYPNFDSWTWSAKFKKEAKKIWADV